MTDIVTTSKGVINIKVKLLDFFVMQIHELEGATSYHERTALGSNVQGEI